MKRIQSILQGDKYNLLIGLVSLLTAFVLIGLVLGSLGRNPFVTWWNIIDGSLGSWFGISETLIVAAPIMLCALSVSLAQRVGLLSLGAEGQLHLGAIGATLPLVMFGFQDHSSFLLIPLMVLSASFLGGFWALAPGLMRTYWNVNETLTTLLLNYVAILLLQYLVDGPFKDPESYSWPQSPNFPDGAQLIRIGTTRLHLGVVIGPILAVTMAVLLGQTKVGFISKVIGKNPLAAEHMQYPIRSYLITAMVVSGAIAGLAGFIQIAGIEGRLRFPISNGYGISGFLVAWISNHKPLPIIMSSFLFAALLTGADSVQLSDGLPFAIVNVIQGILFLSILGMAYFRANKND